MIRWKQFRTTTADGLGIDDFSLTTTITGPTGPSVSSTSPANNATDLALNTAVAVTFDQGVNASGSAFTITSASRGVIAATLSVSPDQRVYTFTPPTNFDFLDTVSVKVSAAGVTSVSTGLHPAADYNFSFVTAAPVPPAITAQPVPVVVSAGNSASFSVGASGTAPFSYQWRKGGLAVSGNATAATATLVLNNVQATDVGSYDVVVGNGVGSPVTSNPATLSVTPSAPQIVTQPVGQTVAVGDTVTLTVTAKGTAPFSYQWRRGTTVVGSSQTLVIPSATVLDSGSYTVVVSNGVGSPATSTAVSVLVIAPPSVLNYSGGTYAQDFNTLPLAGTFTFTGVGPFSLDANPGVNAPGLPGWSFGKAAGSGANALFRFDNGGNNSGAAVSYGTTGAPDRALGSLASGTMASRVGVTMVNTSGQVISYVTISYTGEQWRHGGVATPNKLAFSYAVGTPDIASGTFTSAPALDFTAPITTATTSALDGNLPANRVTGITATLTGLNWAPGQTLVLRWTDVDDGGADDGLAIDDFTLTNAPPVPVITAHPVDLTVPAFSPASFTVAATSLSPLTYQWRKNFAPITDNPSALTATLQIANATAADAGDYDCVVTNSFGSTPSDQATLATTKIVADVALDGLTATYDGAPKPVTATTAPLGLNVLISYEGGPLAPTDAGSYAVVATVDDENYEGSATGTLVIGKALASVTLGNLAQTYTGAPLHASALTGPGGLAVVFSYDGNAAAPINAGSYAVVATVNDANYVGGDTGTLVIAKAAATVTLSQLAQVFDGSPKPVTVTTAPAGLNVVTTYNGLAGAPTDAGSYAVVSTVSDDNYSGSASGTLVVSQGAATISLTNLVQAYDGTPKSVTVTTTPAGLPVTVTYNGSATPPTAPGTYAVIAESTDANRAGSVSGNLVITVTGLVRHAPTLGGTLQGSLQVLTAENISLNGGAIVIGDLLVPGTPFVKINGQPVYGGTIDGPGAASPSDHTVTLNGNSVLRHVVNRTDAIAMPTVAAPAAPVGTRNVTLNKVTDPTGDFATLRDLTIKGSSGDVYVPAGTYGAFSVSGQNALVFGVVGSTEPTVYNLQSLSLNGNAELQVVGPVIINLAGGVSLNGAIGADGHPEWTTLNIASGGLTLNGGSICDGVVIAPTGTIVVNGSSRLTGRVVADRLIINGNGLLNETQP